MKMKKFLAVVLSFALSFSLAMPTFAQDNTASAAQAVQSEVTETSNDENVSADENMSKDASAETVKEDSKTEASKTDEKAEDASENAEVKKEVTKTTKTDKKQADSDASASDIDTSVWTAEDFTYTEMSQRLNGCDYSRDFTVSGTAISGFSETGSEKIKVNKNLVIPSEDPNGTTIVGIADSAFKKQALKDVNLTIHDGEFIGLIGHTGSGKSTLIQHLNGLVRATSGNIYFNDTDIYDEKFVMKNLRAKVGLVFQYPEHQLFEVTVMKDVCFGPHNLGLSDEECEARAKEALNLVGLKEKYWTKSPFELSGGQKRRVAIAGVIAMHPEVLILDEPTAGLDPKGRNDILGQIAALHAQKKMTVILVSHSMEDVAQYVDRIIVMSRGQVRFDDTPKNVFKHYEELEKIGLAAPQVTYLCHELRQKGFDISENVTTVDEARTAILNVFGRTEQ